MLNFMPKFMSKRMMTTVASLVVILTVLFGYKVYENARKSAKMAHFVPPPTSISATQAKSESWQSSVSAVGTLKATKGIDVVPQVAGIISKIDFTSGQEVKAGDLILEQDTSVLKAQLEAAQAVYETNRITYDRMLALYKKQTVSDQAVDQARGTMNASAANVKEIQAQIDQMLIRAPFSGQLGLKQVDLGQYLTPGEVITNLQKTDPMLVDFMVPTQYLSDLKKGQVIYFKTQTSAGKTSNFKGAVTAWDARVDPSTKSITVRAEIPNPDNILYPSMFGEVALMVGDIQNVITVPRTAVNYTLHGDSVYIVQTTTDNKGKTSSIAKLVYVKTGERTDDSVIILSGIKTGDEVVTSGQLKLHDGIKVTINNSAGI